MKTFYRIVRKEYLNGEEKPLLIDFDRVHYGELNKAECPKNFKIKGYEALINRITKERLLNSELLKILTIEKHFKKLYVYNTLEHEVGDSWNLGKINPKKFKSYEVTYEIEELHPSPKEMFEIVPVEEIVKYLKDIKRN